MSIEVKNITKVYGEQKALDNISFSVKAGEVIGFLGPNGAGKSTMMKIVTCFIPPTQGTATVSGYDVEEASLEVRKRVGYLPEHNPLYLDMYVKEYLEFVAGMGKVPNKKARVADMIAQTGLGPEQHKLIGALSKGYRQRVGLAQAMIHDPEVLILDEPTSGLDPNQLVDIRSLIKNLGKEKTVLFSTHIMQEVEAISDRVIIINKGKIVADSNTRDLQAKTAGKQVFTIEVENDVPQETFKKIKGIDTVEKLADKKWKLVSSSKEDLRSTIFQFAVENKLSILTISKEEQRLEDIFRQLTKNTQ